MNQTDVKRDRFFVCLFIISFVVCGVVMAADHISKKWEQGYKIGQIEAGYKEKEELLSGQQEEQFLNAEENSLPEQGSDTPAEAGNIVQEEQFPRSFVTVDYNYFEDALFIGDSRTVGLMEYGNLENAAFFADSGMSVFSLQTKKISVPETGKVSLEEVLRDKQYGKIYLMLGINELGYKFEGLQKKYQETIEYIRGYQGDAVIFLCANLHVTEEQSNKDPVYNNTNVNRVNEMIAGLADGITYFYIDVNELFDDENGNLSTEYSSDSFHVFGKDYTTWADWLCTKAIVVEQE